MNESIDNTAIAQRKTKIICTIGPVTKGADMLLAMARQGMNIARLNMSHGDHESHKAVIDCIKALKGLNQPVAILMDTQGPEIRTGDVASDLRLERGDEITVSVRGHQDVEQCSLQINYEDLIDSVAVGDRITVDNGLINLTVLECLERSLRCRVEDGGVLGSKRHVNLPGIRVNLPAITEKDGRDIQFAIDNRLDFIALSFVRSSDDIKQLRAILDEQDSTIKIIAKIEDQEGVKNVVSIIDAADAVMVARGDLGVEINIEDLPSVQRQIVRYCAVVGKPVIVATHLLESMIGNPIPTRAEVTDVANAVYEEVDAIMLSGETTVGKYPLKCIEYLDKIARASENIAGLSFSDSLQAKTAKQQLAISAVHLADSIGAKGIIVVTRKGRMASFTCAARPKSVILAFTFDEQIRRKMSLLRGVISDLIRYDHEPAIMLGQAFAQIKQRCLGVKGDQFVILSDVLSEDADAIQLISLD